MTDHPINRSEAEDFLYLEAALLDEWRLDDWLALFDESARYFVPTTDLPDADPKMNLVLIDDDIERLRSRVARLKSRHAHREFPWSRTRRLVTNIRVSAEPEGARVAASFVLYRFRGGNSDTFVGHYEPLGEARRRDPDHVPGGGSRSGGAPPARRRQHDPLTPGFGPRRKPGSISSRRRWSDFRRNDGAR